MYYILYDIIYFTYISLYMYILPSRLFTDTSSNFVWETNYSNFFLLLITILSFLSVKIFLHGVGFLIFICLFLHCWRLNPQPHTCWASSLSWSSSSGHSWLLLRFCGFHSHLLCGACVLLLQSLEPTLPHSTEWLMAFALLFIASNELVGSEPSGIHWALDSMRFKPQTDWPHHSASPQNHSIRLFLRLPELSLLLIRAVHWRDAEGGGVDCQVLHQGKRGFPSGTLTFQNLQLLTNSETYLLKCLLKDPHSFRSKFVPSICKHRPSLRQVRTPGTTYTTDSTHRSNSSLILSSCVSLAKIKKKQNWVISFNS